jgi:transcriptional regulator with XRE-family HTH domain
MEFVESYQQRRRFANVLRKLRLRRGLTQTELGNRLGFAHPSSISKIELGRRPVYLDELPMLAKALDCDLLELLPDGASGINKYPLSRTTRLLALIALTSSLQVVSSEGRADEVRPRFLFDFSNSTSVGENGAQVENDSQLIDHPKQLPNSLIWGDNCDPTISEREALAGS